MNFEETKTHLEESVRTLRDLLASMKELQDAKETQFSAAKTLEDTVTLVLSSCREIQGFGHSLGKATTDIVDVLAEVEKFLKQTDLSELQSQITILTDGVGKIDSILNNSLAEARQNAASAEKAREASEAESQLLKAKIQSLTEGMGKIDSTLSESLSETRQSLAAAEKAREAAETESTILKTKIQSLPEKVRRKHNL